MTTINFDSELRRAGAHSTHGWRRLLFLAQRYLLGTVGLVIMVLFVWINGYRHDMDTDTAFDLVLGVARGELDLEAAAATIRPHLLAR